MVAVTVEEPFPLAAGEALVVVDTGWLTCVGASSRGALGTLKPARCVGGGGPAAVTGAAATAASDVEPVTDEKTASSADHSPPLAPALVLGAASRAGAGSATEP